MNKHSRFTSNGFKLAVMALAIGGAGSALAATTPATASATTTVITPIGISKVTDLTFGSIAPGSTPGTVTLTPGSVATAGGGVLLAGGTPAAALFNVTGEGGKGYTLTVNGTTLTGAGTPMAFTPISDFSASAVVTSNTGAGLLAGTGSAGAQSVYVGGVLAVAANQTAGTYTGTITASVDYN
jgi:spore coat protein U-like protein